jgi:uncharacterized protein (DUF58 family)
VNEQWTNTLEQRWIAPAYAGWVVLAISIGLFMAATNTMTGWLYVLSAIGLVLAAIAAILPIKSLQALSVEHLPHTPVTVGDRLEIDVKIHNKSLQPQTMFQVYDYRPPALAMGNIAPLPIAKLAPLAIERVPAQGTYIAKLPCFANRRGCYRWDRVELRSGQPLGLFWCRRSRRAPVQLWVYPQHLRLAQCPVVDNFASPNSIDPSESMQRAQLSTYGTTRSLRPYRMGDPLRLIHWRSSARYGEFRVRELEAVHTAPVVTICLNAAAPWTELPFEQAVVAAASLYFYATAQQLTVNFWTSQHGSLQGQHAVMQALAEIEIGASGAAPPPEPLLWITSDSQGLDALPPDSRYVMWGESNSRLPGLSIDHHAPLANQLQKNL